MVLYQGVCILYYDMVWDPTDLEAFIWHSMGVSLSNYFLMKRRKLIRTWSDNSRVGAGKHEVDELEDRRYLIRLG